MHSQWQNKEENNLIVSSGANKKHEEIGLQLFRTPKALVGWVHLNSDRRLLLIASLGATATRAVAASIPPESKSK